MNPPVLPMLAKRVGDLPKSGEWIFEPKWDGFRAPVFRDGDEILLQSRGREIAARQAPLGHRRRGRLPSSLGRQEPAYLKRLKELDTAARPKGPAGVCKRMRDEQRSLILITPERLYGSLRAGA